MLRKQIETLLIGLIVFSFIGVIFTTSSLAFMDEGTVRIGNLFCASGKGASYGFQSLNGQRIALEEINSAGGVKVQGKMMKMDMLPYSYESGGSATTAVALSRKVIEQDQVLFHFGPSFSSSTEVVFAILQKKLDDPKDTRGQYVAFPLTSALADLPQMSEWAFRNTFPDKMKIKKQFPIILEEFKPIKTVGILVEKSDAYCYKTVQRVFKPLIKEYNLKLVAYQETMTGQKDFSVQIAKLKKADPDLWIIVCLYNQVALAQVEAKRQGWKPKVKLGSASSIVPELITIGRDSVEGFMAASDFWVEATPKAKEIAEIFKKNTGMPMTQFGSTGYEGVYVAKWAIEHSGIENTPESLKKDRRKFRDAMAKTNDVPGLMGPISMFPSGDANKTAVNVIVKGGKFQKWEP